MIWRFLLRCSQTCSLALKRLLFSVLIITAWGSTSEGIAQEISVDPASSETANVTDSEIEHNENDDLSLAIASNTAEISPNDVELISSILSPSSDVEELGAIGISQHGNEHSSTESQPSETTLTLEQSTLPPTSQAETHQWEEFSLAESEIALQQSGDNQVLEFELSIAKRDSSPVQYDWEAFPTNASVKPISIPQPSIKVAQGPNSNTDPLPEIQPLPPETKPDPTPDPRPTPPPINNGDRQVRVDNVQVTGSSIFGEKFAPILADLQGDVSLSQLNQAADRITQLYLEQGYITSRAVVVEESLNSSIVELRVIEGKVDEINLQGNEDISDHYLLSRLRLGTKQPLNTSSLEDQLRLLKLNPIIENIEATLKAGDGLGESDLDIIVTESRSTAFNIGVDNFSPASVGSERITFNATEQNLTGVGDCASLGYIRTTRGGADSLDLSYSRPINAKDGTIH